MKRVTLSAIAGAMFFSCFAHLGIAQTADGTTPAEEMICDPLKADGTTKGLYGLCVAFCEAQDFVEISDPITEEELAALEAATPSGKILANYNKKKQESDPPMPCLVVEDPCPCWSAVELSEIDGYLPDGQSTGLQCATSGGRPSLTEGDPRSGNLLGARMLDRGETSRSCTFVNQQINPPFVRNLSTTEGTLTSQEFDICQQALADRCTELGF